MTAIVLVDDARAELERLAEFAGRPENLYRIVPGSVSPGDRPEFTRTVQVTTLNPNVGTILQTLRVVFSHTEFADGRRFRHASISLESGGDGLGVNDRIAGGRLRSRGMPTPSGFEAVCLLLGFRGRIPEWVVEVHDGDSDRPIVVAAQEIPSRGHDA